MCLSYLQTRSINIQQKHLRGTFRHHLLKQADATQVFRSQQGGLRTPPFDPFVPNRNKSENGALRLLSSDD